MTIKIKMKAIIPVAGIGTRLQPLTNKIPKVLLNVAGKPMLFHLIDEIIKNGRTDTIILIIGHLGEQIVESVNKAYSNSEINFEFVEQKEMHGLGHAVYHAKDFVKDEPVLIVLGDTIFEFNLDEVLNNEYSAIGVKEVENISHFGIVESENGFVKRMIEKPKADETESKAAIAGIYFVKNGRKLFDAVEYLMTNNIRTKNEFQLTDALQKLVTDGEKMVPFEIQNWFDCGKPETLLSTNAYLLKRDTKTGNLIDKNAMIHNSTVHPSTLVLKGSKITDSVLRNCIVYENAIVENAVLEDCIIGEGEKITGTHKNILLADSASINF